MVMRAVEKREERRSSLPVRRWGVLTASVQEVLVLTAARSSSETGEASTEGAEC